jgi:membrane dipeptidase
MKSIRKEVADSLGVTWYERNEIKTLNDDDKIAFYLVRREIMNIANDKAKNMQDVPPMVDVTDFVNHIDYLVEKIGINHVGISSDFDGGGGIKGWQDASETFNVTLELVKRGYSEDEIEKLWSSNLLRVLDEVESIAKTLN